MSFSKKNTMLFLDKPAPWLSEVYSAEEKVVSHEIYFSCGILNLPFCEYRDDKNPHTVCKYFERGDEKCLCHEACLESVKAMKQWCEEWLAEYGDKQS